GEFLMREKTNCEALFVIKEGQLEVYRSSSDGQKITIGLVSSGQYVGETALLLGRPNSSNVVALTPVKAIRFSKTSIESQLKSVPPWLIALTKGLIERLQNANETLRRNGWVDEKLSAQVQAVENKFKKAV
ncbi:MAG: Crp/Fnr family transcriptional regulator, partial [Bdellovibrionales bacterium]